MTKYTDCMKQNRTLCPAGVLFCYFYKVFFLFSKFNYIIVQKVNIWIRKHVSTIRQEHLQISFYLLSSPFDLDGVLYTNY